MMMNYIILITSSLFVLVRNFCVIYIFVFMDDGSIVAATKFICKNNNN